MDYVTDIKGVLQGLGADIKSWVEKNKALQRQVDALDVKLAERHGVSGASSLTDIKRSLEENEGLARFMRDKSGSFVLHFDEKQTRQIWEYKAALTETSFGAATTGVMPIQRIPGIVPEARQRLTVRDLLTAYPTDQQIVDFVKVTTAPRAASPQSEANDKFENQLGLTSYSMKVQTLATWMAASRQVLEDLNELYRFLTTALPYYVDLAEEIELLSGDNTGSHLYGIIPQATAFDTTLPPKSPGWNRIDLIGRACQQIMAAKELEPTFLVCHPTDWWNIRLTKDSYGRYILGDPMLPFGAVATGGQLKSAVNLFGLTPVPTTNITSGYFVIGTGDPIAIEIRDRMGMVVEIATTHSDYFVCGRLPAGIPDSKFSLIDLNPETGTRRKATSHRERLSEKTSRTDGATVRSHGNRNHERAAEMTVLAA